MNIVVLAGGLSTERDVSFKTGSMVAKALKENGHKVILLDVFMGYSDSEEDLTGIFDRADEISVQVSDIPTEAPDLAKVKASRKDQSPCFFGPNVIKMCQMADIVFMALHGENGENGKIQAAFELMGIKYTGTDYISSAISMSKELTKKVLVPDGIPMPKGVALKRGHKIEYVPYPCVVKPCCGGSSVGVSIVANDAEFKEALTEAFSYEDNILVEEYIEGREFSVGVIDFQALPIIEIAPVEGFYDYKNKYKAGATKETCPAVLPKEISERMQRWAEKACESAGVTTYARVDQLLTEDGDIYCLEINTLPGMTGTSLLPQEAAAAGISYDELTEKIIEISLRRYE